eukprot:CAMPEP_0113909128 /NCGR_PEP_ID=MMETSP0780_2-20120614/26623_1 /TAXON_ID=652834 /ORGANISM="Palpitomonas bilix" /LENGTH=257 /DNA_ID=CAMNT_0000904789 /DNA_START=96 /DNA_END=869 /DNA_ORIENTATION=- /assembly_acc=CAM_ASM_000599
MFAAFFSALWRRVRNIFGGSKRIPTSWDEACSHYNPPYETHKAVLNAREKGLPWAQAEDDYKDHSKLYPSVEDYRFDAQKYPLNPIGRTNRRGRNLLGRWGVNPAIDGVVGSWDREKKLFDIVLIKRGDNGAWALPGGMLEKEDVYEEAVREFQEEAASEKPLKEVLALLSRDRACIMKKVHVIDHRETDNAWVETTPVCFNLTRDEMASLEKELKSGDDAASVGLYKVDPHKEEPQVERLNVTHWKIIRNFALQEE